MKVYPVGARILPKTATTGSSGGPGGGTSGSPVFMVAASMSSQNLMRVARTTAQTVTLTSGKYTYLPFFLTIFFISLNCAHRSEYLAAQTFILMHASILLTSKLPLHIKFSYFY